MAGQITAVGRLDKRANHPFIRFSCALHLPPLYHPLRQSRSGQGFAVGQEPTGWTLCGDRTSPMIRMISTMATTPRSKARPLSDRMSAGCRCGPIITGHRCWASVHCPRSRIWRRTSLRISGLTASCWISARAWKTPPSSIWAQRCARNVRSKAPSTISRMCLPGPCSLG